MKIALYEHFSSRPPGTSDPGLMAEGRALRDAAGADFTRLPGVVTVPIQGEAAFDAMVSACDAALVIAPEQDGVLERLCRRVERHGRLLLGPGSRAVRLLADKHRLALRLAAAGVDTPRTARVRFRGASRSLREVPLPFVLKPRDGCGGRGVVLVRRARDIGDALRAVRRVTRRADLLVQEHIEGDSVSVSIVASATLLPLGLNRQRLRPGRALEYLGGETFWPHPLTALAEETARAALSAAAVPAIGYLGVDLVLGPRGATVIEINPRLTTSYIGLRRSIRENLAGLILRAVTGRALPRRVRPLRRCLFGAWGGPVRGPGQSTWRTRSAGTSAASI